MVRRAVAGLGRTMISSGILLLLFVAYQLWGTGLAHARDQKRLTTEAEAQLADAGISIDVLDNLDAFQTPEDGGISPPTVTFAPLDTVAAPGPTFGPAPTTSASSSVSTAPVPVTTRPAVPSTRASAPSTTVFRSRRPQLKKQPGDVLGIMKIPKIGVREAFVKGTALKDLQKGPGHYDHTPLPGQSGNAAIAGHRTTFGAPFFRLDELKPGDPIFVATVQGVFRYSVTTTEIVSPKNVEVLLPKPGRNTLTLTTCHPRFSAAKRMVITADLVGEAAPADVAEAEPEPEPPTTVPATSPPATIPATTVATTSVPATSVPASTAQTTSEPTPTTTIPDEPVVGDTSGEIVPSTESELISLESAGGDRPHRIWFLAGSWAAWAHSIAWAALCSLIWIVAWLVARRKRSMFYRWTIYGSLFVVLFLPALFFCFVNLTRLLPENV